MSGFDELLAEGGEKKIAKRSAKKGAPIRGIHSEEFLKFFGHITKSIARVSTGTKMAVIGDEEIGKTYFCTTMPKPIAAIVTDGRFMEIMFYKYRKEMGLKVVSITQKLLADFKAWLVEKEIYLNHALVIDKDNQPDYLKSIESFKKTLKVITKHFDSGSFIIDNCSDLRLWLNALVDKEAQFVNETTGMPYRFEWGAANEIVRGMTESVREKRIHFCLTAHTKPKYSAGGKETSIMLPEWNRKTSGDLDFIMIGSKLPISQQVAKASGITAVDGVIGPYRRLWRVYKSTKWPEYTQLCGKNGFLEDMTFPSLRADVKKKVGFDIQEVQPT